MIEYQHLSDPFLVNLGWRKREELDSRRQAWGLSRQEFYPLVERWFTNFKDPDKPLALKIVLNLQYFSEEQFKRRILDLRLPIMQYLHETGRSIGDVLLVVPHNRGDSADRHAYDLLKSWGLEQRQVLEIGALETASENSVLVFFNDTHGTGNQFLRKHFPKVKHRKGKGVFVIAITIAEKALRRFEVELTGVKVVPGGATPGAMDLFTATEFRRIRELGAKVYPAHPLGYGDAGLLTAYYFQCPNNTLPLIWADGKNNAVDGRSYPWQALFPYNPKVESSKPSRRDETIAAPPDAQLLDPRGADWSWTPEDRAKIQERIGQWGLASPEFFLRAGDWFANFRETERQLALDLFLAIQYFDIRKVRKGIQWLHDQVLTDILNAGGDIGDVVLVTTGDHKDSVYHYLFEFLQVWKLEVDQVLRFQRLTPDKVIDKTLVLFYHTRPTGNHFFKAQPDGSIYAEKLKKLTPRATFLAAYAMAPKAIECFQAEFPERVLFLEEASKTVAQLLSPQQVESLARIEAELRLAGGPRDANEELLLAYYFQCPEASSPLLWASQPGDDSRRRWTPLFRRVEIPT